MRWGRAVSFLALCTAALLATPAAADPDDDARICARTSGDAAIAACTRAIASGWFRGAALAAVYNNRAYEYNNKDDGDRALADANEAHRLDPASVPILQTRGRVYRGRGDYDRAIADYSTAIRLAPKDSDLFVSRAIAYRMKHDYDRAFADDDEAIRLGPKNALAWNSRCWTRTVANRELPLALADCEEALRLDRDNAAIRDTRGFTYFRLGRFDAALADFDAVLKVSPAMATSLYGRSLVKRAKGDVAGAEADIAAANAIKAHIAEQFAGYGIK